MTIEIGEIAPSGDRRLAARPGSRSGAGQTEAAERRVDRPGSASGGQPRIAVASSTYAGRRIPTSTVLTPGVLATTQRAFWESGAPRRSPGRADRAQPADGAALAAGSGRPRRRETPRGAGRGPAGSGPGTRASAPRVSPVSPWSRARTTRAVSPRTCHSTCSQYVTPEIRSRTPASWSAHRRKSSGRSLSCLTRSLRGDLRTGTPPPAPRRRRAPARARRAEARGSPPGEPSHAPPRR